MQYDLSYKLKIFVVASMLGDIGIVNFYGNGVEGGDYRLKESVDDFAVYEVNGDHTCAYGPLLDLEKYRASREAYGSIPEGVPKEERKLVHDSVRHYPFRRLRTVDGRFVVEETETDIFLCTLMKYNLNTTDAVHVLAKRLGIPKANIQFGGNKDKRGVTFQEISINCAFGVLFNYALSLSRNEAYHEARFGYDPRFDAENAQIVEELGGQMKIEPPEASDRLMLFNIRKGSAKRMGDNVGNRFRVRIRGLGDVPEPPEYFLNYFGNQRFGTELNNHVIGRLILEEKFDDALDLIMGASSGEGTEADGGARLTPVQRYIAKTRERGERSRAIVYGLDRLTRMMYMHAFQSYIFNCDVNRRWKERQILPGDQVMRDGGFASADSSARLEDIYIPLEQKADKFLKGGYRKMIEQIRDFSSRAEEGDVVVEFFLSKSCYATCALREIIGDSVYCGGHR